MSQSFQAKPAFVVGGRTFAQQRSFELTSGLVVDPPSKIPVAKAGSLTTRTDNDTGVATMGAGHGIITGDRIDVYWTVGGVKGSRQGMAATVAGLAVTIDGGAGDVLPAALSAVILAIAQPFDLELTGNNVLGLAFYTEKRGCFVFTQNDNTLVYAKVLPEDGQVDGWYSTNGVTNPLAGGAVGKVWMSHADTVAARIMRFGAGF